MDLDYSLLLFFGRLLCQFIWLSHWVFMLLWDGHYKILKVLLHFKKHKKTHLKVRFFTGRVYASNSARTSSENSTFV